MAGGPGAFACFAWATTRCIGCRIPRRPAQRLFTRVGPGARGTAGRGGGVGRGAQGAQRARAGFVQRTLRRRIVLRLFWMSVCRWPRGAANVQVVPVRAAARPAFAEGALAHRRPITVRTVVPEAAFATARSAVELAASFIPAKALAGRAIATGAVATTTVITALTEAASTGIVATAWAVTEAAFSAWFSAWVPT